MYNIIHIIYHTKGRSRGFAFVEFATAEACKLALVQREQNIKNKQCEIKPAKTRENNFAVGSWAYLIAYTHIF
jgi:RNA recognition motif-containing protein